MDPTHRDRTPATDAHGLVAAPINLATSTE